MHTHTHAVVLINHMLERLILSLLYTQSIESKCFQIGKLLLDDDERNFLMNYGGKTVNYGRKTVCSEDITRKTSLHINHVKIVDNIQSSNILTFKSPEGMLAICRFQGTV